jgi:hypothetical protein
MEEGLSDNLGQGSWRTIFQLPKVSYCGGEGGLYVLVT